MGRNVIFVVIVAITCAAISHAQNIQLSDGTIAVKSVIYGPSGSGEMTTTLESVDTTLDSILSGMSADAVHDNAAITTGPQIQGYASATTPTAVSASGDSARLWSDMYGRLVTQPYAPLANRVSGVGTSTGTEVSVVAQQGAGVSFCATTLVVSNSSAVNVTVNVMDGAGGPVLMTVPASANMGGAAIALPTPLCTTANTALYQDPSAAASSVVVTAVGFKAGL